MSAKKYTTITGASKATATKDLQNLSAKGIFIPTSGSRSTRYQVSLRTFLACSAPILTWQPDPTLVRHGVRLC
ncbi:MAG: hypothetical protein HP498_13785 [Nitrospira sp.]|nr:hypothetical protein [Nitrospira sp.]